jgi:signal transduction histidine kinase
MSRIRGQRIGLPLVEVPDIVLTTESTPSGLSVSNTPPPNTPPPNTPAPNVISARELAPLRFSKDRAAGVDPRLVDGLVATLCATLALASLVGWIKPMVSEDDHPVPFLPADRLSISLVLLGTGALVLRRRHPIAVLAAVGVSSFLVAALGYGPPPMPAAEFVILYTVASTLPSVVSAVATGIIALSFIGADLIHEDALNDDKFLVYLLSALGAWFLGYSLKTSRTQAAIAQENVLLLTQRQQARTQIAVTEEQERICRELHDVVAHSVGVIVAQASAARLVFWKQPKFARGALSSIESTGRDALAEMRVLLRVLHAEAGESAVRVPATTLAGLPLLFERIESAGLPVELLTLGKPGPLPPSVDMAAYRIVQESLTNCLKHAGPARATVRIEYQAERLSVQICDDGVDRPAGDPGRGLLGMHQRATLLGGEFSAGRVAAGWRVRASLPFPEGQSCPSDS